MIHLATFRAIVPQVEALAAHFRIPVEYREQVVFSRGPSNNVFVSVGEIHVGAAYRFSFNLSGKLLQVCEERWPVGGDVTYTPVQLPG